MEKDIAFMLSEIDDTRAQMKDLVEQTDPELEICPGWTIKEVLGHLTAWEIVIHKALNAFQSGDPPYFMYEQDFDQFNRTEVDKRSKRTLNEVQQEWNTVRKDLKDTLAKIDDEDLETEMVLPWGSERPVIELIEIISEHEDEHREAVIKKKC